MIRRAFLVIATVATLALMVGTVAASPFNGHGQRPTTFTVVERALTDVVTDLGAPGDSIGDLLTFGNPVFNAANAYRPSWLARSSTRAPSKMSRLLANSAS